jgi:hypothetical protein
MKKLWISSSACLLALCVVTSCSDKHAQLAILQQIPTDVDVAWVGNITAITESFGSYADSTSAAPSEMYLVADYLKGWQEMLQYDGVEQSYAASLLSYTDAQPVNLYALTDSAAYRAAIAADGFTFVKNFSGLSLYAKEVGTGLDLVLRSNRYVAFNAAYAYWVNEVDARGGFNFERTASTLVESAGQQSVADTKWAECFAAGDAGGALFRLPGGLQNSLQGADVPDVLRQLAGDRMFLSAQLSQSTATVRMRWVDAEGQTVLFDAMKPYYDNTATLDGSVLRRLRSDESLVYATALKDVDWGACFDLFAQAGGLSRAERRSLLMAQPFLANIQGTVALGVGVRKGLQPLIRQEDVPAELLSATLVIETESAEKAAAVMKDLKRLLSTVQLRWVDLPTGFKLQAPQLQTTFYAEAAENCLVFSNQPLDDAAADGKELPNIACEKYSTLLALTLGRNDVLMKEYDLNRDVQLSFTCEPQGAESALKLELTGNEPGGVLWRATNLLNTLSRKLVEDDPDDYGLILDDEDDAAYEWGTDYQD